MTDVRIRRARPADADAVRRVARESWAAAYDDILDDETIERKIDEWYDVDDLAESIERREGVFLVAEDRGSGSGGAGGDADADGDAADDVAGTGAASEVVGFAQAGPAPEDDGGDAYVLARIYLLPDRRGEGIGTRLLDQAIGAIRERGAETLRLGVFADNDAAVQFYEDRGFDRVREKTSDLGEEYVYVREV